MSNQPHVNEGGCQSGQKFGYMDESMSEHGTCAKKSAEYDEQHCYQMCDNSSLYMYYKKLVFSGFSHPVEPEIRIVLH